METRGLAIMDIKTQYKAIQCSVLAKFIKQKNEYKTWANLILWNLDQYRKAKQGINIFKTYINNTDGAHILQAIVLS